MYFEKSKYKDMYTVCKEKYGDEFGIEIYKKAENYFEILLNEADYKNSEIIKQHMVNSIFPILSYYMALLDLGIKQKEAYNNVLEQTQRYAEIQKRKNQSFGNKFGAYFMFRIVIKRVMAKNFPCEGWETEWVQCNRKEIHFNLKRCVYYETVLKYGHPELCTVFCQNDTISFEGFLPKIRFQRNGTIGDGNKMCDFHFFNNKV